MRHKAIVTTRSFMIDLDEKELESEMDSQKKKEKTLLLQLLRNREFFLHAFKKKRNDPHIKATKAIYKKYIKELNVTKYLKNPEEFDSLEWKDRLMIFCTYKAEYSYILFVLGMIVLVASAFF